MVWKFASSRNYSVKSGYNFNWDELWKVHKVQLIVHVEIVDKLSANQRSIIRDGMCPFFSEEEESIDHLFFECQVTRAAWFGSKKKYLYVTNKLAFL